MKENLKFIARGVLGKKLYSKIFSFLKWLKISKNEKKELEKNEEFKNKHLGKRCFIIGNGPSIKNVDLTLLSKEITFTVNQMPRMENFKNIQTNYHIWSDRRFFIDNVEIINIMKNVNKRK